MTNFFNTYITKKSFRNESKGQWARYGKNASSLLKDAEAKPLTDEERERVIRELYFEKVERIVKKNGKVKFEGEWYHIGEFMKIFIINPDIIFYWPKYTKHFFMLAIKHYIIGAA